MKYVCLAVVVLDFVAGTVVVVGGGGVVVFEPAEKEKEIIHSTAYEYFLGRLGTVVSKPYLTFSIGRLADFPDTDEIFISYWNWIGV